MNKTELAYSQELENRRLVGEVAWWRFEGIKLRLADKTFFTGDFAVMLRGGELEIHEIKGFMEEDANVKLKCAAEMYPFTFRLVRYKAKRDGGGWDVREVGNKCEK